MMMFINNKSIMLRFLIWLMIVTSPATAQTLPWDVFLDIFSTSVCDLINAENAELVVLRNTDQLMIVTGGDIILQDTFVDANGFVFFEGLPFGVIDFAEDGDGFRTLWWTSILGTVVHIDEFSGLPSASDLFPSDFFTVPCDAEPFWDGCLIDADCDDANICTFDTCNGGVCIYGNAIAACDDGDPCTAFDACIGGECIGTPISGCNGGVNDGGDTPIITINLCGTNAALSMMLTATALGLIGLHRRRSL